jgi:hypothetical protein
MISLDLTRGRLRGPRRCMTGRTKAARQSRREGRLQVSGRRCQVYRAGMVTPLSSVLTGRVAANLRERGRKAQTVFRPETQGCRDYSAAKARALRAGRAAELLGPTGGALQPGTAGPTARRQVAGDQSGQGTAHHPGRQHRALNPDRAAKAVLSPGQRQRRACCLKVPAGEKVG